MRHNKWNKYLKIACSWILIFSMCFLSLNTVNASAEDTSAFESESETGDTEAFTSDTEISDTEIEAEPSTDQFTSESEETKQETEKQIPDSIEVEQLNAEIQNRVVNGEVPSTDRVEYVDEKGKIIEGAPTTIELGTIADHKDLAITGKNYEFKSARVNGKDCVYIGKYNDTVYYSTDGVIAIKLDDGQKLTMTYQEYYNIKVNEVIPEGGVAGTITTKAGTVKVNTAETIRVNAGETWKFTVKPGTANKVRYKIGSVTAADASSTSITRVSGDEYEAYYKANFQKDDTVTIAYDKEGVYRVTINRTASDGTEYLNEEHSKDALDFTFTEENLDADGAITIPDIHTKRGYRLINMAINGTTLAETTGNNREIPTEEGTGHGITMDANCGDTSYLVTVVMKDSFTTHLGNEKDCSYAYSITIKPRRGNWQDINLNLVSYATGQQVLTVKLYTGSGHRSGDGLDVAMWNPDTKKLDPIHDSDTVNMDSVGSLAESLHKRQVRIFFAKSKNGYSSPIGAFKAFAKETSTGGRVIAETGKVAQLSATTMGETGTLEIYDEIWQEAKNAAQTAGYTEYVVFAGEKTILSTNWEMYVVSFTTTRIDYYVHYKSGLEDDLAVSNIPDNQELSNKKPMHSYGDNPETVADEGRSIGVSFTVGEGNEVPTCSGYEFLGWKLQKKDGTLSSETYQNKDVFTVSEDNVEYADNTNLPFRSSNDKKGYQFVAQWKKISTRSVVVKHYLKVPDGTAVLKKTTPGTISFAENNETVTALATPEPAGTFSGYVFDKSDTRNNLEKAVTNDKSTDTIELNLYYKPTVLTVSKTVTGYNMEPNRSYEFTIKAVPPSGTDASTATITAGQIFIKKGTDKVKNLTFTNNQATFTLAKDESVDISCLPTGWTYTVTETDPGNNYKTSYKLNGSDATDGTAAEFITSKTGNDEVTFTNASTVAPPETGRIFHDSEWILLLIVVLVISAGGMTFLRKMKKRY